MVFFQLMASRAPSLHAHYPSPSVQDHFCSEFYLEPFQTLFCVVLPFHMPKQHVSTPTHALPLFPCHLLSSPLVLMLLQFIHSLSSYCPLPLQVVLYLDISPYANGHDKASYLLMILILTLYPDDADTASQ